MDANNLNSIGETKDIIISRASVCPSENKFKPYKQEQGGDMVDSDKISKCEQCKQETKRLVEQVEERNEAINSKNKEIGALKAQVKKLEDENKESKAKIKFLEDQIKLLEDEIKKLKAEKDDIQKQLNDLRNEQSGLKKELGQLEGNNMVLEEKVDRLEAYVGDLKKENKEKVDRLEAYVGDLKKENKDIQESLDVLKREFRMANRPLLVLGELSFQIASLMYQKVIPQWHNKSGSYSVQDIEQDITGLGDEEDEGSKILAENTWAELKKELNWKEKYVRSLKTVRCSRNTAAHPPIDEELLYKAAEEARKNGDLNKDTYDNIMELIGIWKKLKNIK